MEKKREERTKEYRLSLYECIFRHIKWKRAHEQARKEKRERENDFGNDFGFNEKKKNKPKNAFEKLMLGSSIIENKSISNTSPEKETDNNKNSCFMSIRSKREKYIFIFYF